MQLRASVRPALDDFIATPLENVLERCLATRPEDAALTLFRDVVATVPAYASFLADQGVDPAGVRSFADFERLPLLTRDGYVRKYPLASRCRGGAIAACDMIAFSSGSTGEPTAWPRNISDEIAIARRFEQIFVDAFEADKRTTLAVVCFPLGTWVGGMYTASACRHLAAKGIPITVVTPGNNKAEIFRVLEALSLDFDQIALLGYPPFVKDVVDSGRARGHAWGARRVLLVLAGEVFSEEWRALMGERLGGIDPLRGSAALYGTADAGVLGNETPLSIAIRKLLAVRPNVARALFGEARLPTLVQYDPLSRFFEAVNGTLLFSGDSGVPLVRYHIADSGGIFGYDDLLARLGAEGLDPIAEVARSGAPTPRKLPFVYVFGRADFTVSFFGANIYPENVTVGLERPEIREWVTGKFVLEVKEDRERDRLLSLVVELSPGEEPSEERRRSIGDAVVTELLRLNSEFAAYVPAERRVPSIDLRASGDPAYFPLGVKHRYTRR